MPKKISRCNPYFDLHDTSIIFSHTKVRLILFLQYAESVFESAVLWFTLKTYWRGGGILKILQNTIHRSFARFQVLSACYMFNLTLLLALYSLIVGFTFYIMSIFEF
jgi:hypothetical protein